MPNFTTGPLYIEPRLRDCDNLFGLLLSNQTGADGSIEVALYAAQFTAPNTPETWNLIYDQTISVPNGTVANLTFPIQRQYPYYQFWTLSTGDILPTLYLLNNLGDAVHDFPLIPTGDWYDVSI